MESFELTSLQEQLKRQQAVVREIDDKLVKELTKQAVLEQLYGDSPSPSSENSRSALDQSSISERESSCASVSSSFLRKQISNVYNFMRERNDNKQANETGTRTHLLDTNNLTKHQHDQLKKQDHPQYEENEQEQSSFFHKTTKDPHAIVKLIHKEELKRKWEQEQAERQKGMQQFLQEKQRIRQQSVKQERLKIRQQLLKQQTINKQNINVRQQRLKTTNLIVEVFDNDALKGERSRALSRLLKDVQKGHRNMAKLIERTRIASYK